MKTSLSILATLMSVGLLSLAGCQSDNGLGSSPGQGEHTVYKPVTAEPSAEQPVEQPALDQLATEEPNATAPPTEIESPADRPTAEAPVEAPPANQPAVEEAAQPPDKPNRNEPEAAAGDAALEAADSEAPKTPAPAPKEAAVDQGALDELFDNSASVEAVSDETANEGAAFNEPAQGAAEADEAKPGNEEPAVENPVSEEPLTDQPKAEDADADEPKFDSERTTEESAFRTWTDSTGVYQVEAKFVEFKEGMVQLLKKDGTSSTLPLERLSDADQTFVKQSSAKDKEDN